MSNYAKHSPYLTELEADALDAKIKCYPDFPKPGVLFRDVSPLLAELDRLRFNQLLAPLCEPLALCDKSRLKILAVESRGFIFGTAMAIGLGCPLVLARKAGKLPGKVDQFSYKLEYGPATLELQQGALGPGDQVVIVDDLLATGGTLVAAASLVEAQRATVHSFATVIELDGLGGRKVLNDKFPEADVHALITY